MKRAIYTIAVMLVVASIVHIAVVLLIPSYASQDAWSKLSNTAGKRSFNIIARPEQGAAALPQLDPALGVSACLFDLNEGPIRVEAEGDLPFWSVAVFDRRGQNIYSFNDRTAIERRLLMAVVSPTQRALLRKNPMEELEQAIIVEADAAEGFILLRALQSNQSWTPRIERFLSNATCEKFDLIDQ